MGGCSSKHPKNHQREERMANGGVKIADSTQNLMANGLIIDSSKAYDEDAIRILKKDLATQPDMFVLDNIIMSIMFFQCYESEIMKPTPSSKMEKLNSRLIKEQSKQCLMPDTIFEIVNKNVIFKETHGSKKFESQPLGAQRMFVVYDNIEVMEMSDNSEHYSGIDKPSYRVYKEESARKGFVKLRQVEYLKPKACLKSDDPDNNRSSVSSEEKQMEVEPTPSTSKDYKVYDDSSDSYDYTTITQLKTPQPLKAAKDGSERSNSLPSDCFKPFRVKNYKDLDELAEMQDQDAELFKTISYISSSGFMNHFKNIVFPNSLGTALGFCAKEIEGAVSIPGTVFCKSRDSSGNKTDLEVIPAARIQWPAILTFEWKQREDRPTIVDPRTTRRYRWPTPAMIKNIEKLTAVVIPRGYMLKRGENADYGIEWEVGFPKAEKYLEARMSHAQMRCYLVILSLYKTFIEPKTNKCGLLPEHIRILMYWECERNYLNWTENRLGHKILEVLRALYKHLGKSHLPDYFIREKNVFENIPGKYLRAAQKAIFQILESPLMHFIAALRNLRYTSANLYPALDLKRLHQILTVEGIRTTNPAIFASLKEEEEARERNISRKRTLDPELEWRNRKREQMRMKKTKRVDGKRQESDEEERRTSVNSIDLEFQLEKDLDVCKQSSILLFFIDFHIEVAKRSLECATTNQVRFYLKQALYFTRILEEVGVFLPDVRKYQEAIRQLEDVANKRAVAEDSGPSTPKRNSMHFIAPDHIQVKSNKVNLANLTNAYNTNALPTEPVETRKLNYTPSQKGVLRLDTHENKENARFEKRGERRKTIQFSPEVQSTRI